jgi:hypothetical protein
MASQSISCALMKLEQGQVLNEFLGHESIGEIT